MNVSVFYDDDNVGCYCLKLQIKIFKTDRTPYSS